MRGEKTQIFCTGHEPTTAELKILQLGPDSSLELYHNLGWGKANTLPPDPPSSTGPAHDGGQGKKKKRSSFW